MHFPCAFSSTSVSGTLTNASCLCLSVVAQPVRHWLAFHRPLLMLHLKLVMCMICFAGSGIVEAFLLGGRHSFTSMGPQDVAERAKGAVPGVPGTAIMLMSLGHTAITVKSAEIYSMGCGWTDPPYMGEGPFQIEGRTVPY